MTAAHLARLYTALADLSDRVGGFRYLRDCSGRDGWPLRGVYFFFDHEEPRADGSGPRVVRVGTHALRAGGRTTLWGRLSQHRGSVGGRRPGGGNHRGSVFRSHVGAALLARDGGPDGLLEMWLRRHIPRAEAAEIEYDVERRVSQYIGDLPFLWVGVPDAPGPQSERGAIEREAIALLSTEGRRLDPPSRGWLGHYSPSEAIPRSGLWNVNHVGEEYQPLFLDLLERQIEQKG